MRSASSGLSATPTKIVPERAGPLLAMKSATHNRFGAAGRNRRCTRSAGRAARAATRVDNALAASHAGQPHLAHEPLDGAAGNRDAFPVERQPDLPRPVDAVVARVHPRDLDPQVGIAQRPSRRRPRHGLVVGRRGDRSAVLSQLLGQHPADRLDTPPQPAVGAVGVLGDEPHERGCGRSNSAMLLCQAAAGSVAPRSWSAWSRRARSSVRRAVNATSDRRRRRRRTASVRPLPAAASLSR